MTQAGDVVAYWLVMWCLIAGDEVAHCRRCGVHIITGDVVAYWLVMWWLIARVVMSHCWR